MLYQLPQLQSDQCLVILSRYEHLPTRVSKCSIIRPDEKSYIFVVFNDIRYTQRAGRPLFSLKRNVMQMRSPWH